MMETKHTTPNMEHNQRLKELLEPLGFVIAESAFYVYTTPKMFTVDLSRADVTSTITILSDIIDAVYNRGFVDGHNRVVNQIDDIMTIKTKAPWEK